MNIIDVLKNIKNSAHIRQLMMHNHEFCEYIKQHPLYLKIKNPSQICWHILHNTDSIPRHKNGMRKAFLGFDRGYSNTKTESKLYRYFSIKTLPDEDFLTILKNSSTVAPKLLRHKRTLTFLSKIFNTKITNSRDAFVAQQCYRLDLQYPVKCKLCGKLLKTEQRMKCGFCTTYHEQEYSVLTDGIKNTYYLPRIFNNNDNCYKLLYSKTKHLFPKYSEKRIKQRLYHYQHNIDTIPKCGYCNKKLTDNYNSRLRMYTACCSSLCANKFSLNIAKRLSNNKTNSTGYKTNIGKNEEYLVNEICKALKIDNTTVETTKQFGKFFPDAIIESKKIIIEVFEKVHYLDNRKYRKDVERLKYYSDCGYTTIIVWDNPVLSNEYFKQYTEQFCINTKVRCLFFCNSRPSDEVLSKCGWSKYDGTINVGIKDGLHLVFDDDSFLKCTLDHKIVDENNKLLEAEIFTVGNKVKSINGIKTITSITPITDTFYDLVNTNDHLFYANGTLVSNCLIVDEAAAVDPKIMREFWASVYPTISSGKTTKIIMVSSSNGPGNLFYDLYSAAEAEDGVGDWTPFRIDWWEVPGRDDDWKKRTLRDLNNDEEQFNMQFGNQFSTAKTPTLLPQEVIEKYRKMSLDGKVDGAFEPKKVRFYLNSQEYYVNLWNAARTDRTYIIGVDIADGVGRDYSTITVLDITNMLDIGVVLTFRHNLISIQDFSRVVMVIAKYYNNAHICAESNGLGRAFFTIIENGPYYYHNIVTPDASKGKVGILSHTFTKSRACLWLKDILTQQDLTVNVYDQFISAEMESFIKKQSIKFTTYSHIPGKNDDSLMAFTWALYALYEGIVDKYFIIHRWLETTSDKPIPLYLEYVINSKNAHLEKYVKPNTDITFNELYQYTIEQYDESVLANDLTRRLNEDGTELIVKTTNISKDHVNSIDETKRDAKLSLLKNNESLIVYKNLIEDVSSESDKVKLQNFGSLGFISRSEWNDFNEF